MQRVRIGLTGLACVFLLVLLAAAFFGLTNSRQETGPLTIANMADGSGEAATSPREPLAELGVAPGYGGDEAPGNSSGVGAVPPAGPAPVSPAEARPPSRAAPGPSH